MRAEGPRLAPPKKNNRSRGSGIRFHVVFPDAPTAPCQAGWKQNHWQTNDCTVSYFFCVTRRAGWGLEGGGQGGLEGLPLWFNLWLLAVWQLSHVDCSEIITWVYILGERVQSALRTTIITILQRWVFSWSRKMWKFHILFIHTIYVSDTNVFPWTI